MAKNEPYDFICLDIMMPRMDGQQALAHIRELERNAQIPRDQRARILMLTALADEESVLAGIQAWDAYLLEPIEKTALVEQLEAFGLV